MKNGDPRSREWIKRQLKSYTRDNESVEASLLLVDLDPQPTLAEISTWSTEQCLLAQDWACLVHVRASDNINRVPAMPEHLKPYRRTYTHNQERST